MLIGLIKACPNLKELEISLEISSFVNVVSEVLKNCPIVEDLKFRGNDDDNITEIAFYQLVLTIIQNLTSLKHLDLKGSTLNHEEGQKLFRSSKSLITLKLDCNVYVREEATFATLDKVFRHSFPIELFSEEKEQEIGEVKIIIC